LEEGFIGSDLLRSACGTNGDFLDDSIFYGNINFDGRGNVGHVAFFKSIKGKMGLLNQSICPDGIKSLVLTPYMGCWLGGVEASYGKKNTLWCSASHG
jgi:hypothetical protein